MAPKVPQPRRRIGSDRSIAARADTELTFRPSVSANWSSVAEPSGSRRKFFKYRKSRLTFQERTTGAGRGETGRGGAGVQLESAGNLGTPLPKGGGKDFGKWCVRFCVFLFLPSLGRLYALFSHPSLLPFGFVYRQNLSL